MASDERLLSLYIAEWLATAILKAPKSINPVKQMFLETDGGWPGSTSVSIFWRPRMNPDPSPKSQHVRDDLGDGGALHQCGQNARREAEPSDRRL